MARNNAWYKNAGGVHVYCRQVPDAVERVQVHKTLFGYVYEIRCWSGRVLRPVIGQAWVTPASAKRNAIKEMQRWWQQWQPE